MQTPRVALHRDEKDRARDRIRGESATPVGILTIPRFCRFTAAIARVRLVAFEKGAGKKASCRSKSTHLTGRHDHPRPVQVGGAGCAAIWRESAWRCSKLFRFLPAEELFLFNLC